MCERVRDVFSLCEAPWSPPGRSTVGGKYTWRVQTSADMAPLRAAAGTTTCSGILLVSYALMYAPLPARAS